MYDRLSWGVEHADLQRYLDYLAQRHPNALLLQHPLSEAEVEFWQAQINDCSHSLANLTPVNEHRLKTQPLRYLPFLWHVRANVEAAAAGEASDRELQPCFNLLPQSSH